MLQIEIDGKEVAVEQGKTVMEAAHQIGTYIPHFCYHKKLSIAASCRMCLVEVEKAPKPLPACATPVTDGMKVSTRSEKAQEAQKGVMEFLLINHPLDCPICDQGGECQLQDLAMGYGNGTGRFSEPKNIAPAKDMGPLVSAAEMSRCIHCTRCVRFTEEVAGFQEIGMANRGEHSEIMPFIGKTVTSEISGNVIDLCPVGALTSKPFRYDARSWELSRRKSISAHDALGSNLIVQVKDHRVRRVLPLENEGINECWLSDRDRFAYEGLNHTERLQTPKIKQDNRWHDVDWQTAFDYIIKGLHGVSADYGKNTIGMWVNSAQTIEELYLAKKLAKLFGIHSIDSRLRQQDDRLDRDVNGALWFGQSIASFAESDAVLIVGANMRSEQPLLTARLRKMAQAGCQVSTIAAQEEVLNMPVLSQLAVHPQDWIDVLLQSINTIEEQTSISGSLKKAEKATILLGAQVQNHPYFADIYAAAQQLAQSTDAVLGILPQTANSVGADILHIRPEEEADGFLQMCQTAKKAIILVNVDPQADTLSANLAESALEQAKTVIAMSAYESESLLQYADVLLPIVPFTETSGSLINMEGRLQQFHGVVKPLGEARPLWKVLRVLGNQLGLDGFDMNNSEEVLAEALPEKDFSAFLDNLQTKPTVRVQDKTPKLWRSGSVGLYDSDAIVRRASSLQKTTQAAPPQARIHPETLASLGFSHGENVWGKQADGEEVQLTVVADKSVAKNTLYLPTHPSNRRLGAPVSAIELKRG